MSQTPEWYDRDFIAKKGAYAKGCYMRRNLQLADMLNGFKFTNVFEFAGAEGQLAEFILKQHPEIKSYVWSDFSPQAYKEASMRLRAFPNCRLTLLDMNEDRDKVPWEKFDCVISTAIEHIEKDEEVMECIATNTLVVLGVPSFNSESHVRYFPSARSVMNRYDKYLDWVIFKSDCFHYSLLDYLYPLQSVMVVKHVLYRAGVLPFVQRFALKRQYPDGVYLIVARKKVVKGG